MNEIKKKQKKKNSKTMRSLMELVYCL